MLQPGRHGGDWTTGHAGCVGVGIEEAKSLGPEFLRKWWDF